MFKLIKFLFRDSTDACPSIPHSSCCLSACLKRLESSENQCKGPFIQAIIVPQLSAFFCCAKVAASFNETSATSQRQNWADIAGILHARY